MLFKRFVFNYDDEKMMKQMYGKDGERTYMSLSRDYVFELNRKYEAIFKEKNKNLYLCIYDVDEKHIEAVCAYRSSEYNLDDCIEIFASVVNIKKLVEEEEITNKIFCRYLEKASCNNLSNRSPSKIIEELQANIAERESVFERRYFKLTEELYDGKLPGLKNSLEQAKKIMASDSMIEEIKRIYSKENEKTFYGHPVHYYITAGSWGAARDMVDVLIPALLKNNRLQSKRVTFVNEISPNVNRYDNFENIFISSAGSAVVVDLSGESSVGQYATGYQKNAAQLGKFLGEYGKDTLFIFVEVVGNVIFRDDNLGAIIGNGDIVRIEEGFGDYDEALNYLNDLVEKSNFVKYKEKNMQKYLPDKLTFSVSDVYSAYDKWYGKGLKTHIYKAYQAFESVKIEKKKVETKPYQKLNEMVGLVEIKNVVNEIVAYEKLQASRKQLGLEEVKSARNMLFYGEPGTAKTTVARLLGQILKEEGVLDVGHVVECGRQDLIGKYVGWTAKIVEEKFKEARGGILFIDEAYALSEGENHFGPEAISTLVQLMENYREEVIVILAGYPERMERFIEANEGLRSRVAFQLNFPNYNAQELLDIMSLMLKDKQLIMSDEAMNKCYELFESIMNIPNFGNGRFVRNFLEQIELKQAVRLSSEYIDKEIDKDTIKAIELEDIPESYNFLLPNNNTRKMGLID